MLWSARVVADSDRTARSCLVTGASSGIGQEFALQLAALGFRLTLVARRETRLRELLGELPGSGHDYIVADLGHAEQLEGVARALSERRYQLLVNNAGLSVFEPFYTSDIAKQQEILSVNCAALVCLAHVFLQHSRPGDALINLASIVSYLPTPAQPMYSASKAFIASFSECLWHEHRQRQVYVMGLCPGITATEFIKGASGGEANTQSLPPALVQSSSEVVGEALKALQARKKAIVVTGRVNRAMMWLPRILSRHRLLRLLGYIGDPERAL